MTGVHKLETYIDRYGPVEGQKRYDELLKRRKSRLTRRVVDLDSAQKLVTCERCGKSFKRISPVHLKYGCVEPLTMAEYRQRYPGAVLVIDELCKLNGITLNSCIEKYGEDEGIVKWNEYCETQAYTNTYEYKANVHGMTKLEFEEYNTSRAVTLENLVARHGDKIGNEMWQAYRDRQRYTTTLEYFIETYGEVDGKLKWNLFAEKRADTNPARISDAEKSVFAILESHGYELEYQVRIGTETRYSFDAVCHRSKLAIEYNGDYWHMNPAIYNEDDINVTTQRTAKDIWEYDRRKRECAITNGYEVYYIWELDWKKHHIRSQILEDLKQLLGNLSK